MLRQYLTPVRHVEKKTDREQMRLAARISAQKHIDRQLRQLILGSLLGNYDHCDPRCRPVGRARVILYEVILDPTHPILLRWIDTVPFLLFNAIRDYMIHTILNDPALLESLSSLIQFDRFHSIVNQTMDPIRHYFRSMLLISRSALRLSLERDLDSPLQQLCHQRVQTDLNRILAVNQSEMLKISYRRPALHSDQLILGLQRQCPMITKKPHSRVSSHTG